jgi:hypothetical protein
MIKQDLMNAEISLGSSLNDVVAVLQGLWAETEKNGWSYSKLGSKFGLAIMEVENGVAYMLPKTFDKLTAILYIGDKSIKGDLIQIKQQAITAPLTGIAIIIMK